MGGSAPLRKHRLIRFVLPVAARVVPGKLAFTIVDFSRMSNAPMSEGPG